MAASSSTKFTAILLVISLLSYSSTLTSACGSCPSPKPKPKPKPTPSPSPAPAKCPTDTLKLGVCADVLGLVNVVIGTPPYSKCCALLEGLVDLDVALCLCLAIKANVLGINLDIPLTLSALVSACGKTVPPGFTC